MPDHLTPDQAAWFVLDHFKKTAAEALKLLVVKCAPPRGTNAMTR